MPKPESSSLRYHQATLTMLELPARIERKAEQQLALAERATGRTLPASLREWLCLHRPADLRGGSVSWPPGRDEILSTLRGGVAGEGHYADLLCLGGDGGDGSYWLRLGAGDDPPVLEENEPVFGDDELHEVAPRFSDWQLFGLFPSLRYLSASAWDGSWEPVALDYLLDRLPHSFVMEAYGVTYHHFYGGGRWVRIAPQWRDQANPGTYWWVTARTPERLAELLTELWGFGGFAKRVSGFGAEAGKVVSAVRQALAPDGSSP